MTSAQAGVVLRHIRRLDTTSRAAQPSDAQLLERFATERDEAAFADLVRRYAPMVLNVCRTVLRHEQDAEDAMQATFLVLARKAYSIRQREAVAGWLYEVAHRVASRAQVNASRRRQQERKASPIASADSTLDMTLRDLQRVLHEELRRLPDKYRLPLVLCYLEGRSHEEAARQLGWSKGTFRGRLDRGREHLRRRLASRGIALSAVLCAAVVVPSAIAEGKLKSAIEAASGIGSSNASNLAEGVIRTMLTSKIKVATAMILAVSLVVTAVALTQRVTAGDPRAKAPPVPAAKPQAANEKPPVANNAESIKYSGQVLGPDGKPEAGAKLYLTQTGGYFRRPLPAAEYATSGPDGRFEFTVSKEKFDDQWGAVVVAAAEKFGLGWILVRARAKRVGLTIRLVNDDVPITGQIVDLEGKPVPSAKLTVWQINAAANEDLGPWIEAVQGKKKLGYDLLHEYLTHYTTAWCPEVTTGADGKFRLTGIGRNRVVMGLIEGPTIASQQIRILTRHGKPMDVLFRKGEREYGEPDDVTTYFGADFRLAVAPCQPIVGVVRDVDTKKPIAGATVCSHSQRTGPGSFRHFDPVVKATTDGEGRYRLLGMPTGQGYSIAVIPGKDLPYVVKHVDVPDGVHLKGVTVDIELKRGVWIEGKITDKVTGKPLKGSVEYFSMYSNPNRLDYPGFDGTFLMGELYASAKADGSFRIVGLPGPGIIGVYYQRDAYLRANQREDEFGAKEKSLSTSPYHLQFPSNYNAIAKVDPTKGAESVKCDVTVDPGWAFKAAVLGLDGKPLTGAQSININMAHSWDREPMKTAEFAGGFNPAHPYEIVVRHVEKGLVGAAQPPKQNGGAVAVNMQIGATATGRLVDGTGKPMAGVELELWFRTKAGRSWTDYLPFQIKTDGDGRFRIDGLLPGYNFRLRSDNGEVLFGDGLRSGETKNLGDVQLKRGKD